MGNCQSCTINKVTLVCFDCVFLCCCCCKVKVSNCKDQSPLAAQADRRRIPQIHKHLHCCCCCCCYSLCCCCCCGCGCPLARTPLLCQACRGAPPFVLVSVRLIYQYFYCVITLKPCLSRSCSRRRCRCRRSLYALAARLFICLLAPNWYWASIGLALESSSWISASKSTVHSPQSSFSSVFPDFSPSCCIEKGQPFVCVCVCGTCGLWLAMQPTGLSSTSISTSFYCLCPLPPPYTLCRSVSSISQNAVFLLVVSGVDQASRKFIYLATGLFTFIVQGVTAEEKKKKK